MLFSHLKRLCIIGPSLVLALPQQPSTTSLPKALPSSLQSTVPECARQCLESALYTTFPVSCTSQGDLGCLCSSYNTAGASLGEVVLGCLYSSCSSISSDESSQSFNVCAGKKDAVLPTQSALTVTALQRSLSTATTTTSALSARSTTRTTSSPTTLQSAVSSSAQSASVAAIPSASITLRASAASSNGNSTASLNDARTLNTSQIIGISVAGAAVIILAVGAMVLSICLRRRHERRAEQKLERLRRLEEKNNNATVTPPSRFPLTSITPPPAHLKDPRGAGGVGVAVGLGVGVGVGLTAARPITPVQRVGLPHPYSSTAGTPGQSRGALGTVPKLQISSINASRDIGGDTTGNELKLEDIGLAISPEDDFHASPESFVSSRTMSRLLPDKPVPSLVIPQQEQRLRSSFLRPDSVMTTVTVFEEDTPIDQRSRPLLRPRLPVSPPKIRNSGQGQMARGARAHAESYTREIEAPQTPTQTQYSFGRPQFNQPTAPRYGQNYGQVNEVASAAPLSLNIPIRHSTFQPYQPVSPIQEVMSPPPNLPEQELKGRVSSTSSLDWSRGGYIPDYYISPEDLPRSEKLVASPVIQRQPSKSPKLIQIKSIKSKASSTTVSRSTSVTSRSRRDSMGSNTTFDSVDVDDPTPEEDDIDKQLSPVAESPISNLRYPKVPRASNQAVARSPRSPKSPKSLHRPNPTDVARTHSPTPSLLVKRRGALQAQELESRLWTPDPYNQGNLSSRQGHGRSGSDESMARSAQYQHHTGPRHNRQSKSVTDFETQYSAPYRFRGAEPEMEALKSPPWVPKLTPTRHGDDLFISVV